jgi:Zn-dependent protease with chaperone function
VIEVDYAAHGLTLSLAWFLVANAITSVLMLAAARALLPRATGAVPGPWLLLRLTPAIASLVFVLAFFVPSYLEYEPRESVEGFDLTLAAIAAGAAIMLATSLARGGLAWFSAARRVRQWIRQARPVSRLMPEAMPLFVVDSDQAFIALSGIRRHRLIVTRGLINALTSAELNAAIAHELGHRRAWDNLKRLAIRSAPDFLGLTRTARELERRWASGAEHAADRAAGPAAAARCALASALVKVARLTPADDAAFAAEPISTLISGGEIASRVRRLLDDRDADPRPRSVRAWLACAASGAMLAATYSPLLRAIHETTERLIRILP